MALRTEQDYRAQLVALLPPGPAWDLEAVPELAAVLEALALEFARVDACAEDLLGEMVPSGVRALLSDWERVLGLPDPCLGADGGFAERRAEVVRRFGEVGRQDPLYFVGIARKLGYPDAWIEEYRAPRFGRSAFGRARFGTRRQQFLWKFHLGARRPGGARFGVTQWGERFGANPNNIIECVVRRYRPAHTHVIFEYQ
ncbi:YmfQ family protein [Achromobacter xylosoxidans]|uniref:YmfQ family protein n=1 Tax=Alcaligenes xylosoxydans xylosoxydans TaxID=85698 RepID=UPI001F12C523|nr:putative phage tail protein [Achromobacter xylosoxidans]